MKPSSIETGDPVVTRLQALARERPDLEEAARIYETVLPLLRDIDLRVAPVPLTLEEAREKLEKGLPLLSGLDLELDENAVHDLMLRLARSIESIRNRSEYDIAESSRGSREDKDTMLPGAAREIRRALEENRVDCSTLLALGTADETGSIESLARGLCLDPGLMGMLVRNALKPALGAWRRQLEPFAEGVRWDNGYCFLCGADATLGELRDNTQALHLRCAQCGADWQARRLRCVWCGNEDHETLGCLYNEDQRQKMRVEVCDTCRGYLKVISFFSPTPPEMLPVEDLATLHLDYIAQARGYGKSETER